MRKSHASFVFAVCAVLIGAQARAAVVSTELALLIDVSGSVSTSEFDLQRQGYIDAFRNPTVQSAIVNSPNGIAVSMVYWASTPTQAIGWTHLQSAADANAFADLLAAAARPSSGVVGTQTGIANALNFAFPTFADNGFEGTRLVIDVSGDGTESITTPANTAAARDAALAAGITAINGLVIEEGGVQAFYTANVIGGTNAFVNAVTSFNDFGAAIISKLEREIIIVPPIDPNPIPEPSSAAIALAMFAALAGFRRR